MLPGLRASIGVTRSYSIAAHFYALLVTWICSQCLYVYLEYSFVREEEVRGLQVTMKDPVVMEMVYCPQQLYHQCFYLT